MPLGPLPGFRDFYPAEFAERAYIQRIWRAVAQRYAFVEYDGPPLEPTDLYTRKSGAEIVEQLYNFTDKGGREVALRPEMTPTLARMVAARAESLRKPVRWFSIPQVFRYERTQRGRLREHFQLNIDIVGEADVTADAELVACAVDLLRGFGLTKEDVVVRFSDRRLLNELLTAIGATEAQHGAVYATFDKVHRAAESASIERLTQAGFESSLADRLVRTARTGGTLDATMRILGVTSAGPGIDRLMQFEMHVGSLLGEPASNWLSPDLSIVRGLAYYTGIVFEAFDRKGEGRAICGGGRYDTLLEAVGGVTLPALGFAMGDVVLSELLRDRGMMRPDSPTIDVWIVREDGVPIDRVLVEAARLRREGRSVEYALRQQSASKQKQAAKALGAREIITLTN